MCGICGFNFEDKALIKKMMDLLQHRGPDEEGSFTDKNISLGHRRLSIIDLSTGQQPIFNEDNSKVIIFNGEIYNYKELKEELEELGHKFKTNSDTETIIHGYEEWGPNVCNRLNGCFAFAIYDLTEKTIFLARDRLGIKPLYYTNEKNFIFASEIKSILVHGMPRLVNQTALSNFLTFRCNPTTETMFKNIHSLEPAHYLIFKNGKFTTTKYWDLVFDQSKISMRLAKKKLLDHLKQSIKYRLMSDVPLGAYISGGIDSATVTALMNEHMQEPIKTFSVGFSDKEYSELPAAKVIADHFKTDHQEIIVDPDTSSLLPKIVWHNDEPMSDPTCIPTYLLSEETKKKCTVVLTGEGADETLAGYFQYKMMKTYQSFIKRFPYSFRQSVIFPAINQAPDEIKQKFFKYGSDLGEQGKIRLNKYLLSPNPEKAYLSMVSIFDDDEKKEVLSKPSVDIEPSTKKFFKDNNVLNNTLHYETKTTLPANLLMKVDKMTMAHGVEARVPFLDHELVEFCSYISPKFKMNKFTEKYILRKTMKPFIPSTVVKRKKQRFFVPINKWFEGQLKDVTQQVLDEKHITKQGIFNPQYIEKAISGLKTSPLFYARQLWSLLNFQLWHKQFIENTDLKVLSKL